MTLSEHLTFLYLQNKVRKEVLGTKQYLGGPEMQVLNYIFTHNNKQITLRATETEGKVAFVYANVLNLSNNTTTLVEKEKQLLIILNEQTQRK